MRSLMTYWGPMIALSFGIACCSSGTTPADAAADGDRSCSTASDCASGEICVFATPGCATRGVCTYDTPDCGTTQLPHCACSGQTFIPHCVGPQSQWVSVTSCDLPDASFDATMQDAPAVDASMTDVPATSDSGGGACDAGASCPGGLTCCGAGCKNLQNDPLNCGGCGNGCSGSTSMCLAGTCVAPVCAPTCASGSVCCEVPGPGPASPPTCTVGDTCPVGCPLCR